MSSLAKSENAVHTIKNITKTNQSLVHIRHSITIRQYKYWHLLLTFFNEQIEKGVTPDEHGFYYESRLKFKEYLGYELGTKEFKADIEALRKEPIIINYLEKDGKPAIHGMGFVSEYKISSTKIGFKLPSFLEKVIKGDKESKKLFLLLNWNIFNSFTGKYEAIIYKLCKDYLGIGRTPYFSIDDYREYVGLKDGEYSQFFKLNEWTIKKPLKNINENKLCDLTVNVVLHKVGRTVKGLHFEIENKNQSNLPFAEFKPSEAFKFSMVSITIEKQAKYLEQFSEEEIQAIIERANEYIEQLKTNGKSVNMGAIYNKAFTENWGQQRLQDKAAKQQEEEKRQNELKRKQAAQEAEIREKKSKQYAEDSLIEAFEAFAPEIKSQVINSMLEKSKKFKQAYNALNDVYLEHGHQAYNFSPMFKGNLIAEIKTYQAESKEAAFKADHKQLIADFESLPSSEKLKEVQAMIALKKNNKPIYDLLNQDLTNFGVNAYKQSQDFNFFLVEYLVMSKIVKD